MASSLNDLRRRFKYNFIITNCPLKRKLKFGVHANRLYFGGCGMIGRIDKKIFPRKFKVKKGCGQVAVTGAPSQ
jgi:hypothetical protein